MATRKSTTKAKTKTATKRTTKTATAKKKVSRTTGAKVISASSKTKTNKLLTTRMLHRLHVVSAALMLSLIVPVVLRMKETLLTVTMPYMTKDPLDMTGALAPAVRELYVFDLRWLIVTLLIVSTVFSLLYATKLKDFYNRQIQKKQLWPRWVELAIVTGLMFEAVALLSGWQTLIELKFVWLLAIVMAYMGYKQEQHYAENGSTSQEFRIGKLLMKLSFVFLLAGTAITTYIWGLTEYGWHVYALYIGIIVFFIWYGRHFKRAVVAPALVVERNYIVISTLSRIVFVGLLVAGLYR